MVGRHKLDDTIAACNMIMRLRKESRKRIKKILCISFKIDGINVGCNLIISYNPSTEAVNFTHSLKCKTITVYPTIHQKLNCHEDHALEILKKQRELIVKRNMRNRNVVLIDE